MGTTNLHTLSLQSPHSTVQTSCLLEEHKFLNMGHMELVHFKR